tara:strand:+ start:1608 stop:2192 length:585 start_codon:yes stop_codon:yes gene_type:complete
MSNSTKKVVKNSLKETLKTRIETSKNNPLIRFEQLRNELKGVKKEVLFSIITIEKLSGSKDISFEDCFKEFKTLINLTRKKGVEGSNDKTRLRRCLYRTIEANEVKKSIQSDVFNLASNLKGIKISTKLPIEYNVTKDGLKGDAITSSVDNNHFTFFLNSLRPLTIEEKKAYKLETLLKAKIESDKKVAKKEVI